MTISRRDLLAASVAVPLVGSWNAYAAQEPSSDDRIRAKFPETYKALVAHNALSSAYSDTGQLGVHGKLSSIPTIEREFQISRRRIEGLAYYYSQAPQVNSSLSPEQIRIAEQYRDDKVLLTPEQKLKQLKALRSFVDKSINPADDLSDVLNIAGTGAGPVLPHVGLGLDLLSITAKKGSDIANLFLPSLQDIDKAIVRETIAKETAPSKINAKRQNELHRLYGIPVGVPSDQLLEGLPKDIADILSILREGPPIDKKDAKEKYLDLVNKRIKALFDALVTEQRKEQLKAAKAEADKAKEEERIKRRAYNDAEIEGAITIGGAFIGEVLGDRKGAKIFTVTASEIHKLGRMFGMFGGEKLGTLALTGGSITAALTIMNVLSGAPSQDVIVQRTMQAILSAIQTVRQEMHERFDRIERTQYEIMGKLEDILRDVKMGTAEQIGRLNALQESIQGSQAYIEETHRNGGLIPSFNLEQENFYSLSARVKEGVSRFEMLKGETYLNFLKVYANDIAHSPPFTREDIREWSSVNIANAIESSFRPDLLIGLRPAIHKRANDFVDRKPIRNPVEWCRAAEAFNAAALEEPVPLTPKSAQLLGSMYKQGQEVLDQVTHFMKPATRTKLSEQFVQASKPVMNLLPLYYEAWCKERDTHYVRTRAIENFDMNKVVRQDVYLGEPTKTQFPAKSMVLYQSGLDPHWSPVYYGLDMNGQRNPIDVAIEIGLCKADVIRTDQSSQGAVQSIRLTFNHGRWQGRTTGWLDDVEASQDGGMLFDYEPLSRIVSTDPKNPYTLWFVNGFKLLPKSGSTQSILKISKSSLMMTLQEIKDEVVRYHARLQKDFYKDLESYVSNNSTQIQELRALGSSLRLAFAFDAWSSGTALADTGVILSDHDMTLTSPAAIQEYLRFNYLIRDLETRSSPHDSEPYKPKPDEEIYKYGQRLLERGYNEKAALLGESHTTEGPRSIRKALAHLEGLAVRHGIEL